MKTENYRQQVMAEEIGRAQALLSDALCSVEDEGGSIDYFATAILAEALKLQVELRGLQGVLHQLNKHAAALVGQHLPVSH